MKKVCVLLGLSLIFFSCSNSYESIIENYNKKYFKEIPQEGKREYTVDADDFDQCEMLAQVYEIEDGMNLSLVAPKGGSSYKWTAMVPVEENEEEVIETVLSDKINLVYPFPGVFKVNVVNKLILTVVDSSNTEYKDTALIIVK